MHFTKCILTAYFIVTFFASVEASYVTYWKREHQKNFPAFPHHREHVQSKVRQPSKRSSPLVEKSSNNPEEITTHENPGLTPIHSEDRGKQLHRGSSAAGEVLQEIVFQQEQQQNSNIRTAIKLPDETTIEDPIEFSWSVNDPVSGNNYGQQETRTGNKVTGSYYTKMADGRIQHVTYHVDATSGFVAKIHYEQPGQSQTNKGPVNLGGGETGGRDGLVQGQEGTKAESSTVTPPIDTTITTASSVQQRSSTMEPGSSTLKPDADKLLPGSSLKPESTSIKPSSSTDKPLSGTSKPERGTVQQNDVTVEPGHDNTKPEASTEQPQVVTINPASATVRPEGVTASSLESVSTRTTTVDSLSIPEFNESSDDTFDYSLLEELDLIPWLAEAFPDILQNHFIQSGSIDQNPVVPDGHDPNFPAPPFFIPFEEEASELSPIYFEN